MKIYVLQPDPALCPDCKQRSLLLCPTNYIGTDAAFYICWTCRKVRQIACGLVQDESVGMTPSEINDFFDDVQAMFETDKDQACRLIRDQVRAKPGLIGTPQWAKLCAGPIGIYLIKEWKYEAE